MRAAMIITVVSSAALLTPALAAPVEGFYATDSRHADTLYRIDPVTGATVEVGNLGLAGVVGLAADPYSQRLYVIAKESNGGRGLYEVDPDTADVQLVRGLSFADFGHYGFAIAEGGDFYSINFNGQIIRNNLFVSDRELLGQVTPGASASGFAGTFDPATGSVWFGERTNGRFYELDTATGEHALRFGTGPFLLGSGGIAADDEGRLFGAGRFGPGLFLIDTDTGDVTPGLGTGLENVYDITYLIPAPASLAPLLPLGFAAARRRRRAWVALRPRPSAP